MLLPENYQGQEPYDDCVNFICEKFDEAAKGLPATRTGAQANEFGLATSVVAKAMKAKMLLYAASPLFNGNSKFYSDFKDIRTASLPIRMYVLCATPSPTILQRTSRLVPTLKLSGLTHVARAITDCRTRVYHTSVLVGDGTAWLLL